jgi:hypothetical protein
VKGIHWSVFSGSFYDAVFILCSVIGLLANCEDFFGSVRGLFEVLSRNLPGGTKGNKEKSVRVTVVGRDSNRHLPYTSLELRQLHTPVWFADMHLYSESKALCGT